MPTAKLVLAIGKGLDRASGLATQNPTNPVDARNIYARASRMSLRPGLNGTGFPNLPWGTDLLAVWGVRATHEGLFVIYDRVSREIRVYRLDTINGVLSPLTTPANGLIGVVSSNADFPIVSVDEAAGLVFIAHDEADMTLRLQTVYYTSSDTPTPGALTFLEGDLDGGGSAPIYFRGVVSYLVYMNGWGFGSASQPKQSHVLRQSLPGDAATFQGPNYVEFGAKGDAIILCAPTGDVLAVCKEQKTYKLLGTSPDDFDSGLIDDNYGAVSSRCGITYGGLLNIWSADGPRRVDPLGTTPIGQPLELISPLPSDFGPLGPSRECFGILDPERYLLEWCWPDTFAATSPTPGFMLSLWNPDDPRWTYSERQQSLSCAGQLLITETKVAPPPKGYTTTVVAIDGGLAADAHFRNVSLSWNNVDADGDETVQLWAKPDGGAWDIVTQFAVVPGLQSAVWSTADPLQHYELGLNFVRGGLTSPGFAGTPDDWTSVHAADSKADVTTSSSPVTWSTSTFTPTTGPELLTWTALQQAVPYLLELSTDGGATWSTVASDLVADSYSYTIPSGQLNTTVKFRLTAQRGAIVGPTAGVQDVTFAIVIGTPALTALWDPMTVMFGFPFAVVTLDWTSASNATSYLVEKSSDGGATWSAASTMLYDGHQRYNPSVGEANTTLKFRVTGQNGIYSGPPSAPQAVTLTTAVTGPVITSLTSAASAITVTYTGSPDAFGYNIEVSRDGGVTYSDFRLSNAQPPPLTQTSSVPGASIGDLIFVKVRTTSYTLVATFVTADSAPDSVVLAA